MADFGYDIADFTDIDPIFGTLQDFTDLTAAAKANGSETTFVHHGTIICNCRF